MRKIREKFRKVRGWHLVSDEEFLRYSLVKHYCYCIFNSCFTATMLWMRTAVEGRRIEVDTPLKPMRAGFVAE
jgi:hypothetical protein